MNKNPVTKILWLAAALLLAGCSTYQVSWDSRVGVYTYNQAVRELGPPDKQAKLDEGDTVADWVSRYSTGGSVGPATGFYSGPASMTSTAPAYRESTLRLTFNTNNVLTAWSRN